MGGCCGNKCELKQFKVKKLHELAKLPVQMNPNDSGYDVCSVIETILKPFERCIVPTGLSFEIPEGYEIQVRPRSGLAAKFGITVLNAPGTVDQSFTGEIKIILINFGDDNFKINIGDRIAQLVPAKTSKVEIVETNELHDTIRGSNGFGSTGIH